MENSFHAEYDISSIAQIKHTIKSWKKRLKLTYVSGSESEDNSVEYENIEEDRGSEVKFTKVIYSNLGYDDKNKTRSENSDHYYSTGKKNKSDDKHPTQNKEREYNYFEKKDSTEGSPKTQTKNERFNDCDNKFCKENQEKMYGECITTEVSTYTKESFQFTKTRVKKPPHTLQLSACYQQDSDKGHCSSETSTPMTPSTFKTAPCSGSRDDLDDFDDLDTTAPFSWSGDDIDILDTPLALSTIERERLERATYLYDYDEFNDSMELESQLKDDCTLSDSYDHSASGLGVIEAESDSEITLNKDVRCSFDKSLGSSTSDNSDYHSFEQSEPKWDPYVGSLELEPFKRVLITNFESNDFVYTESESNNLIEIMKQNEIKKYKESMNDIEIGGDIAESTILVDIDILNNKSFKADENLDNMNKNYKKYTTPSNSPDVDIAVDCLSYEFITYIKENCDAHINLSNMSCSQIPEFRDKSEALSKDVGFPDTCKIS